MTDRQKFAFIRPLTERERQPVLQMMREFYASPAVWSNGSEAIFVADIDNCLNNSPYLEGFVFVSQQNYCGYAMVAKSFSTEFGKPCMWLEDLFIKAEYRGQGLGSLFIEYLQQEYPQAILRLEVEDENERAVQVYKKQGFSFIDYREMIKNVAN